MKFVNQLTHDEILELIPFYHVYDFEECKSMKAETRMFKIQPTYGGPYEDVEIGDSYEMGTIQLYGVKEDDFIKFMLKKFGKRYFQWYERHYSQLIEANIFKYAKEQLKECEEKMKHYKSIAEENS
ncbi:MAG: hypothetical protein IJ220_06065 [Clostridia bacterium]|nr:hypothetical protein [Clostridia bacterium]